MRNFINSAKKVLLGNKKKGYTLPTNNKLYPAQWNWDSGFIALGYSHFKLKYACLLYTSPSPRDDELSRMPSSA